MEQEYEADSTKVEEVLDILENNYSGATTELKHKNPFQLLIATMLSAQTTDKQVNKVTPQFFERFPRPVDFAGIPVEKIEEMIKTCGYYKTKAKNIKEACIILVEKYNGDVPATVEKLMELPGVGRKTANVVASNAFAKASDVHKTEQQLMRNLPKSKWSEAHHWLIHHGRRVCKARKPLCHKCPLTHLCDYYKANKQISTSGH